MKAYSMLPSGYNEIFSINLQQNKKLALILNFWAGVIAIAMVIPASIFVSNPFNLPTWQWWAIVGCNIIYIVLHELVHGITMKVCGTKKVKYGFTGLYAFAGSDDFYDKSSYITIALAPVVVFGIILAIAQMLLPAEYFWIPWVTQVANISGAVGDAYVTSKFSKMPKDILVSDCGVGMTVYSRQST